MLYFPTTVINTMNVKILLRLNDLYDLQQGTNMRSDSACSEPVLLPLYTTRPHANTHRAPQHTSPYTTTSSPYTTTYITVHHRIRLLTLPHTSPYFSTYVTLHHHITHIQHTTYNTAHHFKVHRMTVIHAISSHHSLPLLIIQKFSRVAAVGSPLIASCRSLGQCPWLTAGWQ